MAQESIAEAYQQATQAGFKGQPAITIVCIAKAESGLDPTASNSQGNSAGVDRGIMQINSYYHSEVSDAQAYNPVTAFQAAYRISKQGTDFSPWVTYTTTNPLVSYKRFITQVTNAVNQSGVAVQPSSANLKQLFGWLGGIIQPSQNYAPPNEWGNDIGLACDTHVFSPYAGTVAALTRTADGKWGCVVAIHLHEAVGPYNSPSFYIQHLDAMNPQLTIGQEISIGTFVGWSGGEIVASQAPAGNDAPYHSINGRQFSSGPHLEIGFNGPNGAAWAATGPSFNPHDYLVARYNSLINGNLPVAGDTTPGATLAFSQGVVNTLSFFPTLAGTTGTSMSFADVASRIDFAEEWTYYEPSLNPLAFIGQFTDNLPAIAVRGSYLALGALMLLAGGWLLLRKPVAKAANTAVPAAVEIGALL